MTLKNIEAYTTSRSRFVLVVDSGERNRRFLSGLLKQFGYEPYAVGTVAEAVELVTVMSPVLVVAARQLDAGNDARGLLTEFRSANCACTAPLIVLIAKADPAFERECLNAGALTCLRAPITLENFYRVIQVAIELVPRMTIRISTDLSATINGKRTDERVRELSENGAYVLTGSLYSLRTRLGVRIKLAESLVTADAEVIYMRRSCEDRKGQAGMGLQFIGISPEDQKHIRLFIRRKLSRDATFVRTARSERTGSGVTS